MGCLLSQFLSFDREPLKCNSRCQFVHPVEGKILVNEIKAVAPVPRKVLNNSMGIEFDEDVEDKQYYTRGPPQAPQQPALRRAIEAGNSEQTVRNKVTHKDQVHDTPEDQPRVVLQGRFFKLVVLRDLSLHLALDDVVQRGIRVLARLRLLEDTRVAGPQYKTVVFGLAVKQPSNTGIVGGAPEEKYSGECRYAGAFGQYEECEDQATEDSKDG
jgi:hypothetical protein